MARILERLQPAHLGHAEIEEHDVVVVFSTISIARAPRDTGSTSYPEVLEAVGEEAEHRLVVVNRENPYAVRSCRRHAFSGATGAEYSRRSGSPRGIALR